MYRSPNHNLDGEYAWVGLCRATASAGCSSLWCPRRVPRNSLARRIVDRNMSLSSSTGDEPVVVLAVVGFYCSRSLAEVEECINDGSLATSTCTETDGDRVAVRSLSSWTLPKPLFERVRGSDCCCASKIMLLLAVMLLNHGAGLCWAWDWYINVVGHLHTTLVLLRTAATW